MELNQIKREIKWYTDEIAINERDLRSSESKVLELKRKISENKRKLDLYKKDLVTAEAAARQKSPGSSR